MRKARQGALCCVGVLALASVLVACDGERSPEPRRGIRFLAGDVVDLGVVPGKSTHIFSLANETHRTIDVSGLVTSCGCAAAVVRGESRIPAGGRCDIEFTFTVRAGKLRKTTLTALSRSGDVASLRVRAKGRASRWRAVQARPEIDGVWLGDERSVTLRVESMVPLAELQGPPHAEWICLDSGRVTLGERSTERRPDGTYIALCEARIQATHTGRSSATPICRVEGNDIPVSLSWEVASPLGLGAQELTVPLSSTPATFSVFVAPGLSVVEIVRPAPREDAGPPVAVKYVEPATESGASLRVHFTADAAALSPDLIEVDVVLQERDTHRLFKTPVTFLFLSQARGDR